MIEKVQRPALELHHRIDQGVAEPGREVQEVGEIDGAAAVQVVGGAEIGISRALAESAGERKEVLEVHGRIGVEQDGSPRVVLVVEGELDVGPDEQCVVGGLVEGLAGLALGLGDVVTDDEAGRESRASEDGDEGGGHVDVGALALGEGHGRALQTEALDAAAEVTLVGKNPVVADLQAMGVTVDHDRAADIGAGDG